VRLHRKYFWSKVSGGVCPGDELSGIAQSSISPGAAELCCLMGIGQDFAQGAGVLVHRVLDRMGTTFLRRRRWLGRRVDMEEFVKDIDYRWNVVRVTHRLVPQALPTNGSVEAHTLRGALQSDDG